MRRTTMKRLAQLFLVALVGAAFFSCGDPTIEIDDAYEPKIVVEAYVYPERPVEKIHITRNFPLNERLDLSTFIVDDATVLLDGTPLVFDAATQSYKDPSGAIAIDYDTEYTLEVTATIDGVELYDKATTRTPKAGFDVDQSDMGTVKYGDPIVYTYTPSDGTDFYAASVIADSASVESFIYDNNYFPTEEGDFDETGINRWVIQYVIDLNIDYTKPKISKEIEGTETWFYGPYTTVVYAGDDNMMKWLMTGKNVQQMDGNFLEPRMEYFETGDAIGVFGSAIADTIRFRIVP